MRTFARFVGTMALGAAVLVAAVALVVYSGTYDVSAKSGHSRLVEEAFGTLMVRSVRTHARDIVSPVGTDFRDPAVLENAAAHYEIMCRTCHGAPGKKADPWLLYPPAPDLAEALRDRPWTDPEVFWIIKHGIKDSAMGAFGGTHPGAHSDAEIWGLTALIRQFATLPAQQYKTMAERGQEKQGSHGPHQPTGREQPPSASEHGPASPSGPPHKHQPEMTREPTEWGRPTGGLELPDGSLLFSDDENDRVFRVTYVATGGATG